MSYFILQQDDAKGPYTIGQLRSMWNSGSITADTLYCQEGFDQWLPLLQLRGELEPVPANPPSLPASRPSAPPAFPRVQTVEATGKGWKGAQLISALIAILAIFAFLVFPPLGGLMVVGGIFVFCLARIGAWWGHG